MTKFSTEKSFRSNIQVKNEWLNAVNLRPEVQKRLSSRRAGHLVRDAKPVFDMLKITEMNYNRQQQAKGGGKDLGQDSISFCGSDSDDSSAGSSYVGDLPSIRATFHSGKKSPPSSPTNEGITVTGKRTSMFVAKDRVRPKNISTKTYLSPKSQPQTTLTYGRGSYRKSMRNSIKVTTSESEVSTSSPTLSAELHEWLNSVMNPTRSMMSNTSIDLASGKRTPDRPSSRGGGMSLSSLGSSEVRLSSFTPKSLNGHFLSDDDDDAEGMELTQFNDSFQTNDQLRTSSIHPEPSATALDHQHVPTYPEEDNGHHPGMKYGPFGASWDPKRTKPFKRRVPQQENIKLKITREVAKSRAKYKIPDYVSEATRGKNPLIPPELREPMKTEDGVDIIELLSESMVHEKKILKRIPATTPPTTSSRPLTTNPLGTLITGLSLTTASSSTLNRLTTVPTLLTLEAHSPQQCQQNDDNQFFLTESLDQDAEQAKISKKFPSTTANENRYYLDSSEKKSLTMTDTLTPELYIMSKSHPSLTNIATLPSLTGTSTSPSSLKCSQIIQPHAAFPFTTYGPWIPKGGMGIMISDKSDPLFSWEENRDIKRFSPYDNTEIRTVLKRQNVIRNSFEGFSKKQLNM